MTNWLAEVERLEADLRSLAARLRDQADTMELDPCPPSEELIDALTVARKHFGALAEQLVRETAARGADAIQHGPTGVRDLRELVRKMHEAHHRNIVEPLHEAQKILSAVGELSHRDSADFPSLRACQEHARSLYERIEAALHHSADEAAVDEIRLAISPFVALVQIVGEGEDLSDDALDWLEDLVTDSFGKDLARAANRRRLKRKPALSSSPSVTSTEPIAALDALSTESSAGSVPLDVSAEAPAAPGALGETVPAAPRRKSIRSSTTALLRGVDLEVPRESSSLRNNPARRKSTRPPPPASILHGPVPLDRLIDGILPPSTPMPVAAEPVGDHSTRQAGDAPTSARDDEMGEDRASHEPSDAASIHESVAMMAPAADEASALPRALPAEPPPALPEALPPPALAAEPATEPRMAPSSDVSTGAPVPAEARLAAPPETQVPSRDRLPQEPLELAKLVPENERHDVALNQLLWELIRQGRSGIAYHVARCLEARGECPPEMVPSSALRALALGPYIVSSFGELVDDFGECIHNLHEYAVRLEGLPDATRFAGDLVLLALSLRPALLAPGTGAATLLEQLDLQRHLGGLISLRKAILAFSHLNLELTPAILKGVREQAAWDSQVQSHREKCRSWREHARRAQIVYVPATHVWRTWFERGGPMDLLFDIVLEDQRSRTEELRRAVDAWSSQQYIDQMVSKTDREIRPDARTKPIEARARVKIQDRVKDAMSLLREWLDLLEHDPNRNADPAYSRANECRREVLRHLPEAENTVRMLVAGQTARHLVIAGQQALDAIVDMKRLFDPDAAAPSANLLAREILCDELLTIPALTLDSEWSIPSTDYATPALLEALLGHIERGSVNWRKAFEEQSEQGNHEATELILERLAKRPVAGLDVDDLRRLQQKDITDRRTRLKLSIRDTHTAIERAIAEDLFPESEVLDFRGIVENTKESEVLNFAFAERRLDDVRRRIDARRLERIDEVRARLKNHPRSTDLETIERALEKGDLLAANEYIAMLERGEPIRPVDRVHDVFAEFFPAKVQAIQSLLDRQGLTKRELIRALGRGESQGPLDMSGISDEQAEESKKMLSAWNEAFSFDGSDVGGRLRELLAEILRALGFRNAHLSPTDGPASDRVRSYTLQSDPIREQQTCVIPQYGSLATGRYRVLCVWKRTSEEEHIDLAGSLQHPDRTLILYFGRMSDVRRRNLALLCRQRRRTFLLIDENVVFFLATAKGQRLPALFSCTFPFTVIDPYTTTAGLVPQEMFFGRSRERQSVFEPTGTSLVYGGRQLGKTALLRDVERRYHAPARGIVVKWIDLKAEGIGLNRPIRDLWTVIATVLHQEKVLARPDYGPDTLGNRVSEWLDKDASRRVVLLLDEADAFLKSDAETPEGPGRECFSNLWRLKGIMDKTGRRFKVVFAGLHNVQRTSRDVNSPLAHLGTPICIGPLLENGEWQEARRLVTMPFSQLGYRFESEDLPTRILAHANWYPSLIQLFCKHLLEHLTHPNRPSFSVQACPPYTITSQHIEEAYQSQELRKAIVDRFRWTLDLDPRYRVIALVIAHESATRREGLISGYSVQWIREQALAWWEAGFKGTTTLEGFRTILDEMIGLGLLRKVGSSHYALRSPNVVNLLGTKEEIEQAILDAAQHQPPPEYEASTFRRAIPPQGTRRSPLTAQQESELFAPSNGVFLLFGSKAAGLDDILTSLRTAVPAKSINVDDEWVDVKSAKLFKDMLHDRIERRDEGLSVFIVPTSCQWAGDWVVEAASKVAALKSPKKFVKIIFVGDPQKAWLWVQRDAAMRQKLEDGGVNEVILCPWHDTAVRRWLIDIELGLTDGNGADQFTRATGNWGFLLHEVAKRCEKGRHQWERHLQDFERELVDRPQWLDLFELQPAPRTILKVLADMEDVLSLDDFCELVPTISRQLVEQAMAWAELLGYATLVGAHQWRIDRLLGRLLSSSPA